MGIMASYLFQMFTKWVNKKNCDENIATYGLSKGCIWLYIEQETNVT